MVLSCELFATAISMSYLIICDIVENFSTISSLCLPKEYQVDHAHSKHINVVCQSQKIYSYFLKRETISNIIDYCWKCARRASFCCSVPFRNWTNWPWTPLCVTGCRTFSLIDHKQFRSVTHDCTAIYITNLDITFASLWMAQLIDLIHHNKTNYRVKVKKWPNGAVITIWLNLKKIMDMLNSLW